MVCAKMRASKKIRSLTAGEKLKLIYEAEVERNMMFLNPIVYEIGYKIVRGTGGKNVKHSELGEGELRYILVKRQFGYADSTEMCLAIEIVNELRIDQKYFKASREWILYRMGRFGEGYLVCNNLELLLIPFVPLVLV